MIKKQFKLFMKHSFQVAGQIYLPIYVLGYIVMIGLNIAFFIRIISYPVETDTTYLANYLLMNQYLQASIFMIISYSFLRFARNSHFEETINGIEKYKFQMESIKVIFLLIFIYSLFMYGLMGLILKQEFFTKAMQYTFFYKIVLAYLALALLSYLLSFKDRLSKLFIFIFILLISPIISLFSLRTATFLSIEKYLYYLSKPFEFIQFKFLYDPLYGAIMPFSLYAVVISLIMFFIYNYTNRIIIKYVGVGALLMSLIMTYYPKSEYTGINSWYTIYQDRNYYDETKLVYPSNDYTFTNYKMDISFPGKLKNKGSFIYESSINHQSIDMTVNHAYKVKLMSDAIQSYTRKKDCIKIHFKTPINKAVIKYEISGFHPALYTNRQACLLPGYVAWYPFPGKVVQYIKDNDTFGFNLYNRIQSTMFHITVHAPYFVDTNLIKKGKSYEGLSDSVTILGGQLINGKIDRDSVQKQFNTIFHQNITLPSKVIYAPLTLYSQSNNFSTISIFKNYMLLNDANFFLLDLISYYVYSHENMSEIVKNCLSSMDYGYIHNSSQYIERLIGNINEYKNIPEKKIQNQLENIKAQLIQYKNKYGVDKLAKHIGDIILHKVQDDLFIE